MSKKVKQNLTTCPVCDAGVIEELLINKLGIHVYVCNECNALWRHKNAIHQENMHEDFSSFMDEHQLLGLKEDLTIISVNVLKAQED
jgi:hypothetical protein